MKQAGQRQLAAYTLPLQGETLTEQMVQYLEAFDHAETAVHNLAVAQEAKRLAERFQVNAEKAYLAALLHDASVVIPHDQRIALQIAVGEPILDAERQAPFCCISSNPLCWQKRFFRCLIQTFCPPSAVIPP